MPSIPQIAKALDSLGLEYQESEDYLKISCPFASQTHEGREDVNPSFDIDTEGAHCWSCKYRADLEQFFEQYADFTGSDKTFDFDFEQYFKPKKAKVDEPNVVLCEDILNCFEVNEDKVRDYLDSRGVYLENLPYELLYDSHQKRVVLPVRNADGGLVGCTSRATENRNPLKAMHYFGMKTQRALGGFEIQRYNKAILVEGATDLLAAADMIHRHSLEYDVYCIFGSQFSSWHAELLAESGHSVFLAFDEDKAGIRARKKAKELLTENFVIDVRWEHYNDIGEFTEEFFLKLFG